MGIIRLILAACVLVGHCPSGYIRHFLHPMLAVQCFYGISGFLIQGAIVNYQSGKGWQGRFYLSRFLRLYPLYAFFSLLTLLLLGSGDFLAYLTLGQGEAAIVWLLNNLFIFGQDLLRFFYFDLRDGQFHLLPAAPDDLNALDAVHARGGLTLLGQSWTLAIEGYFYLLAPFLLLRSTRLLGLIVALLFALRIAINYSLELQGEWLYGFLPCELAIFLCGALGCRLYKYAFSYGRLAAWLSRNGQDGAMLLGRLSAAIVGSLCILYAFLHIGFWGHYNEPPLGAPFGYWLVLLLTLIALPFCFHFSKAHAWDRSIGDLSYPLYISHMTVLQVLTGHIWPAGAHSKWVVVIVLVTCLALSWLLAKYVDDPIDRMRHRLLRARQPLA